MSNNISEETVNAIRRGAAAGLTAMQIAATLGIHKSTIRAHAKKHGISIDRATAENSEAIRAKQIKDRERSEKRKRKAAEKTVEQVASDFSKISNPHERKEAVYAYALLTFERNQAAKKNRPPLPYGSSNKPKPKEKKFAQKQGANKVPIVIDGVKFPSRTEAARSLGLGRCVFSSMISPKASELRRNRLSSLVSDYKQKMAKA